LSDHAVVTGAVRLSIYRSPVWSTTAELVVTEPSAMVAASAILHRELDRVDRVASRFRGDSEISLLHTAVNDAPQRTHQVSPDLFQLITTSVRAAALTDGAVDPTVGAAICRLGYDRDFSLVAPGRRGTLPSPEPVPGWQTLIIDAANRAIGMRRGTELDLGATAKAWAADHACAAIADQLGCGVLVSLGGDVAVRNAPAGGFTVGIADIHGDDTTEVAVAIRSGGLATSGIGRRHWTVNGHAVHHLIDPATGLPADSCWRTVSVAAGSCVDANTASTASMIKGVHAVSWLERLGLPARLVSTDGRTTTVAGWPPDPVRS
jgi:FAD:protein FMN transferase